MITTDLRGRVERMNLKRQHVLQPLYEAVSNAIHGIQTTDRPDGYIRIELIRDASQPSLLLTTDSQIDRGLPEIIEIRVSDNGAGFTDENFASFGELDTRHKLGIGGKGVGRLVWLKVFDRITVSSTYRANGALRCRRFEFLLPSGIEEAEDHSGPGDGTDRPLTIITLLDPRDPFREALHHRATTVRDALVRHFTSYLLRERAPRIEVVDGDERLEASLDGVAGMTRAPFSIGDQSFTIDHLKLRSPAQPHHAMHLCADGRVVRSERLRELPEKRLLEGDEGFYYQAYVSSPYLDANVNEQRTGFQMEEDTDMLGEVSYSALRTDVGQLAREHLDPCLTELARALDERVADVFKNRIPELGYLFQQNKEAMNNIPLDASERDIQEYGAKLHYNNLKNGREQMAAIVDEMHRSSTIDLSSFSERFGDRLEAIARPSQADLASYMLFRRSIIDIYGQLLEKSENQFQKEAALHRLIFPMGRDHDTAQAFLEHNLWLIDERLTFANYLASDLPLRKHQVLFGVEDRGEPDVVAYYFPIGFSDENPAHGTVRNVVIIEFKRPGYGAAETRKENPWQQVIRYIERLREGDYFDGKRIQAGADTRFYCYLVWDPDKEQISRLRREYQFKPIFDGEDGFFLYNDELKAWAEVVPLARLLRDSERKHKAFFDRLGLRPSER